MPARSAERKDTDMENALLSCGITTKLLVKCGLVECLMLMYKVELLKRGKYSDCLANLCLIWNKVPIAVAFSMYKVVIENVDDHATTENSMLGYLF